MIERAFWFVGGAIAAVLITAAIAQTPSPPPHMPGPSTPSVPIQSVNPQEQVERTIGSLFVQNTTLMAQVQSLQMQLTDLKKQLADAKATADPKAASPAPEPPK